VYSPEIDEYGPATPGSTGFGGSCAAASVDGALSERGAAGVSAATSMRRPLART
jgi:hypothetical protein